MLTNYIKFDSLKGAIQDCVIEGVIENSGLDIEKFDINYDKPYLIYAKGFLAMINKYVDVKFNYIDLDTKAGGHYIKASRHEINDNIDIFLLDNDLVLFLDELTSNLTTSREGYTPLHTKKSLKADIDAYTDLKLEVICDWLIENQLEDFLDMHGVLEEIELNLIEQITGA